MKPRAIIACVALAAYLLAVGIGGASAATPVPSAAAAGSLPASPGTNPAASSGFTSVSTNALETRLAEARANFPAAGVGDAGLANARAGVSTQDIWMRRALLHRLVRLYEQQLSNAAELESTKTRKAELVREAQAWTRFSQPLPYSIHLTDRLREELQAE